jgi:hypothetical protein
LRPTLSPLAQPSGRRSLASANLWRGGGTSGGAASTSFAAGVELVLALRGKPDNAILFARMQSAMPGYADAHLLLARSNRQGQPAGAEAALKFS